KSTSTPPHPKQKSKSKSKPKSKSTPTSTSTPMHVPPPQQATPSVYPPESSAHPEFVEGPSIEEYNEELGEWVTIYTSPSSFAQSAPQPNEGMCEGPSIEEFDEELGEWVTIYTSPSSFAQSTPGPPPEQTPQPSTPTTSSAYPNVYAPESKYYFAGASTQSNEGMGEGPSIEEFDEELGEWVTIYTSPSSFAQSTPGPTPEQTPQPSTPTTSSAYPSFYAPESKYYFEGASTQSNEGMGEGPSIEEYDEELGEWVTIYTSHASFAQSTPQPTPEPSTPTTASNYPKFYAPESKFDISGAMEFCYNYYQTN
ncbi:hypothetical protein DICPUDRAFT_82045, partial [Dictyostelium purpureum]